MPNTLFGIVYGTGSAQVRRFIYPTLDNSEIAAMANLQPGEALTTCARGPYPNAAAWNTAVTNAVTAAAGKAPGSPRCCVISNGNVIGVIMADPAIDSLAGVTLVSSDVANIGWTWTSGGGFVAPAPFVGTKP